MPLPAQPARPDVELKKNKTALLRGDAFGEYFHMAAARVLKPVYEGTLLYVDIKPRLDVLAKLIRDNNGLTKKAATDFQTMFKEWAAGCEDTAQLKQRLRLLQQPASPKIKLASYGCNLREPQVEVVTNNTAPLLPPPDFETVIQPYGTYIVKGETWGRRKKDGFAEINATPVIAEAFSKGKDECEACLEKIRAAWLDFLPHDDAVKARVREFAGTVMKAESQKPKIVIWSRLQRHEPFRNIIYTVLEHLVEAGRAGGCQVILAGDTKLGTLDLGAIKGDYDLRGFYKTASGIHPAFDSDLLLLLQLYFFYHLYREYNLVGIIGAKSGFMDAFGFLGIPQLSLEFAGSIGSSRIAKLTHIPHFFVMPSEAFVGIAKTPPTTESIVLSREKSFITNFTRLCIALKHGSGKNHAVLPALRQFVTTTGTRLKTQEEFLNAEFNDDKVGFKDPGDPQPR